MLYRSIVFNDQYTLDIFTSYFPRHNAAPLIKNIFFGWNATTNSFYLQHCIGLRNLVTEYVNTWRGPVLPIPSLTHLTLYNYAYVKIFLSFSHITADPPPLPPLLIPYGRDIPCLNCRQSS
jgi:hypothetical protein